MSTLDGRFERVGVTEKLGVDDALATLQKLADLVLFPVNGLSADKPADRAANYEARYEALVERIPAVVFVAPMAGNGAAYVSPQIESILGFTQQEWLEDPLRWYQQVHPEDKERWSQEAAKLFSSGEAVASTYRVIARDGRIVWFQCDARMVHSADGTPLFVHGIGFDVTALKESELGLQKARLELESRVAERTMELARINVELKIEIEQHKRTEMELRKAKEEAELAARIKAEFLANMSHEIRTPMNGVLGMTNLVLDTKLTEEQREFLSIAHRSAESLMGIINQVLDFSKLESGKAQLDATAFSLRNLIVGLIGEYKFEAARKGLILTYSLSSNLSDSLLGDHARLRQVLSNLVGNAIKFTKSGNIDVEVKLDRNYKSPSGPCCQLNFSVMDTGIGVPESKTEAIFEPFMQADGSLTRVFGGTGLGLAITKDLVELMGGSISVSSVPGKGATFSFTAQFGISPNQAGRQRTISKTSSKTCLRILVAEDNPINQRVATATLENAGYLVTLAHNGREALDAYMSSSFDLVLMDVQMPIMDGMSAARSIRAVELERAEGHTPIIGVTAHAMESDRARCLAAGMDAHLSKPYKPADLLSLIQQFSNKSLTA